MVETTIAYKRTTTAYKETAIAYKKTHDLTLNNGTPSKPFKFKFSRLML